MIYAAVWRALPGPVLAKAVQALVLVVAAVLFCFLWLFPRIAPLMPFNDNTVEPGASQGVRPAETGEDGLTAVSAVSALTATAGPKEHS
jgi:hypothetical protein